MYASTILGRLCKARKNVTSGANSWLSPKNMPWLEPKRRTQKGSNASRQFTVALRAARNPRRRKKPTRYAPPEKRPAGSPTGSPATKKPRAGARSRGAHSGNTVVVDSGTDNSDADSSKDSRGADAEGYSTTSSSETDENADGNDDGLPWEQQPAVLEQKRKESTGHLGGIGVGWAWRRHGIGMP